MEENKLNHSMPTRNSTKPTSQNPVSFSLEPNDKLMNKTQECKSPNIKGNDDKAKDPCEEGHSENGKVEETGRERLKRHREEMMGQVKIPEDWGQEKLLKDWVDYTSFDALFAPQTLIVSARDALIADGRKASSQRLRVHSSC